MDYIKEQLRLEQNSIEESIKRRQKIIEQANKYPESSVEVSKFIDKVISESIHHLRVAVEPMILRKVLPEKEGLIQHIIKPVYDGYLDQCKASKEKGYEPSSWYTDPFIIIAYSVATAMSSKVLQGSVSTISVAKAALRILNSHTVYLDLYATPELLTSYMRTMLEFVNIVVSTSSCVEELVVQGKTGNSGSSNIVLTKEYKEKIDNQRLVFASREIIFEPMVCPPKPHTNLVSGSGGYLTKRSPLLKAPTRVGTQRSIHPAILSTTSTNPMYAKFFERINKIQSVPYRVDKTMLGLYTEIQKYVYSLEDDSKKFNFDNELHAYTTTMAYKFKDYPEIYYPLFNDNRGRFYPYCQAGLSYQGDDLGKSLVEYAHGRKLTEEGIYALKFALGEFFGFKEEGDERVSLIDPMIPELIKAYNEKDWGKLIHNCKKPFSVISIVKELAAYDADPEYISHKVLHNDSCSSGLQLIGLFTKCLDSLKTTNVINPNTGDKLGDLYMEVADASEKLWLDTVENLHKASAKRVRVATILTNYTEVFDDRGLFKTPAMTFLNYGAKKVSVYEHIAASLYSDHTSLFDELTENFLDKVEEEEDERIAEGKEPKYNHPYQALFFGENSAAIGLRSNKVPLLVEFCDMVWEAMEKSNSTAVNAQRWMGQCIRYNLKAQGENGAFFFRNPISSFPVVLRKLKTLAPNWDWQNKGKKVTEKNPGIKFRQWVRNPNFNPDEPQGKKKNREFMWAPTKVKRRQYLFTNETNVTSTVTSSIPGIIHSGDGAVMVGLSDYVPALTGIHDSAGTHPNDVPDLKRGVAEMLKLCADIGYFQNIGEQCGYDVEPPMVNTLKDTSIVLETKYAFS